MLQVGSHEFKIGFLRSKIKGHPPVLSNGFAVELCSLGFGILVMVLTLVFTFIVLRKRVLDPSLATAYFLFY